jgi:flagellar biosynthetic protein FlhB
LSVAEQEGRTEAPTPRRLQQSREAGETALSREFVTFAVLAGAVALLTYQGEGLARRFSASLATLMEASHRLSALEALDILGGAIVRVVLPVCGTICAMAILATFGQTRLLFNLSALQPKLSRLDPRARLSRMFGATALLEVLRAAAKLAIVALGAWVALAGAVPGFVAALSWTPISLTGEIRGRLITIATSVLGAFAVVAVLDVVIVQWQHWRKLRMSRQEIRDEHRDTEGDPLIKRRIRQLQQQRARRRMMAAVPKATVVLTNPTHYAVALAYDRAAGGAPKVVAKGADEVAARIREMAEKHGVPLVANPPLARALFKVELGGEIPAEHYRLVAEIIAYVWRLRGHAAGNA